MHSTRVPSLFIPFTALLLGSLVLVSGAWGAASGGEVLHEGGFLIQDLEWTVTDTGEIRPMVSETRHQADPGMMDLPTKEMIFLIPLDATVRGVVVEPLEVHTEKVPGDLAKAGSKLTDSGDAIIADPVKSILPAPVSSWGEFSGTHTWRGYRLLTVKVFPLRVATEGDVSNLEFLDKFC